MMSNNTSAPAPLVVENSGRWLGNDGSWSTFYVHVGTPPQNFHVIPSFEGQTLYVPKDEDCARLNVSDCGGLRGVEVFNSRPSLGFQVNQSSTWEELGIYRLGIGFNLGLIGNGLFGYDTMGPSAGGNEGVGRLQRQAVAAYATEDLWLGILGLSMYALNMSETEQPHSFLSSMKEEGLIPSLSFGYQAGAPYRYTRVAGSLTLGGYDRSRISNESLLIPVGDDIVVGLQSISATFANGTATEVLNSGILAVVETTVPELWLPRTVCDAFAAALNLTYHEPTNRYALLTSTYNALLELDPTFSFRIGSSVSGGETITIELPYAAFDVQASYPIFAESTRYFPIRRAANESQYTLGRVFLQEAYLSVDWERQVFNISQAHFSAPMPESEIITIEPKNDTDPLIPLPGPGDGGSGKKLSSGAIAGIAVGGVVLLILLAGFAWWFMRRKKQRQEAARDEDEAVFDDTKKPRPDSEMPEAFLSEEERMERERARAELEGRPVAELDAPHRERQMSEMHEGERPREGDSRVAELDAPHMDRQISEMYEGERPGERDSRVAEVEGSSPIHELPSPG